MKKNKNYPLLRKLSISFILNTVVFFCIKLTVSGGHKTDCFDVTNLFYYFHAYFFIIITWEINDWIIKIILRKNRQKGFDWFLGMKILGLTFVLVTPIIALVYYLARFEFYDILKINDSNSWLAFRVDFFRASLLEVTVIVFNLFYFSGKVKKDLEKKMIELEKEVMSSKYKSLKSQISPHFLFNSLNTLTSLMYEDRDLASDFVARLSSCYRYILENEEEDLVSLDKELSFLDSFIFMMDVRHKISLKILTEIQIKASDYVIPTLSIQMLIENALKHNYYSVEHPLLISIKNSSDKSIVVENTLRVRNEEQESTKMGIDNIKKRFSFYTNDKVEVSQDNTIFRVSLPLLKKEVKQRIPLQTIH